MIKKLPVDPLGVDNMLLRDKINELVEANKELEKYASELNSRVVRGHEVTGDALEIIRDKFVILEAKYQSHTHKTGIIATGKRIGLAQYPDKPVITSPPLEGE